MQNAPFPQHVHAHCDVHFLLIARWLKANETTLFRPDEPDKSKLVHVLKSILVVRLLYMEAVFPKVCSFDLIEERIEFDCLKKACCEKRPDNNLKAIGREGDGQSGDEGGKMEQSRECVRDGCMQVVC